MTESEEIMETRLWALGRRFRALRAIKVDYEQPEQEAAYYAAANEIIDQVVSIPARTITGLRVKADAVTWCYGGRVDFGPEPTIAQRLVRSLVEDLIAV